MTKKFLFIFFVIFVYTTSFGQHKLEYLDRGLVAVKITNGVYLSWRMLGTDPTNIGFNIYRGTTKVNSNPITTSTNVTDASGTISSTYTVKPIINGVEQAVGGSCTVWATQGLTVQLDQPIGGTTPDAVAYTYSPNDCSVGDVDGDGQWEIILKWDPSNSKDNSQSGYTGNVYLDCYELDGTKLWRIDLGINIRAGAHYTQFLVGDYNVDGKAEIVCKTAPGTKDGTGVYLSNGPAASDNDALDYRNSSGYILTGNEYVTVFNGQSGKEMATVNFNPLRGTVSSWGDNYGNRVDRFLAMNAYLDGVKPSIVYCRGYYTRMAVTSWDWDGTTLSQRWYYNAPTSGSGGYGQGNHNWTCGDVDNDGKDEIIHGSCAIDDNGNFMYRTGLGHGDAIHMGEMDLDNPGLEVWEVHEETSSAYGYELHDARTGTILWGTNTGTDNGRGNAADVDANSPGYEMWSSANYNTYSSKGAVLSTSRPSYNFRIYWDGDLQDELLDGNKLDKWNGTGSTRLITFTGNSCNTTKATPNLSADILGDWREEVILHDGASKLYVYTTTIPTTNKMYTLMHDPMYRNAISWQNTAYNQPPHLSFLPSLGVDKIPVPNITLITGSFTVKPEVQITSPLNGTTVPFLSSVTIAASATDSDGSIVSVSFYNGSTLIGTDSSSPYSVVLSNVTTGTYSITARATDDKGATSVSSVITLHVNPGTYIYTYDNSGNKAWLNSNSWTPKVVPTAIDTAIIRTGEVQISTAISSFVKIEPNGIFRMIGYFTVPKIELLGGTLQVSTSNTTYGLNSTIKVLNASTINSGSAATSIFWLDGTIEGNANLSKIGVGVLNLNVDALAFTGNWNVESGTFRIANNKSIGQNIITVTNAAIIDITVSDVYIENIVLGNGILNLNYNLEVKKLSINGIALLPGVYTSANYPGIITGTGYVTVIGALDCAGVDGGTAYYDNCATCVGGTTGKLACIQDCNGDWGGTAIIDNCEICAGGTTGLVPCSSFAEAENVCSFTGTIDSNNAGFTGVGFINLNNAIGSSIVFNLHSTISGNQSFSIVYANGGTVARPMIFNVNGVNVTINFDVTGSWTTWKSQLITIQLQQGVNQCTLTAQNADGGPNIDKFIFINSILSLGSCTVDCNGITGGTAYVDFCGVCVGGNTGKTACVNQIIPLQQGLNLVSINVHPADSNIANIFAGLDLKEVKTMDGFWLKGQISAFNSIHSIEAGKGYLVIMNTAGNLVVTGTPSVVQINEFAIQNGWKLLGCYNQVAVPFSTYFNTTNCTTIKNFEGFWIPNGTLNSINNLEPGKAYFIKK